MKELESCPFCGGDAKLDYCRTIWKVCCTNCDALVLGESTPDHESEDHERTIGWDYYANTAVEAWNKRVEI